MLYYKCQRICKITPWLIAYKRLAQAPSGLLHGYRHNICDVMPITVQRQTKGSPRMTTPWLISCTFGAFDIRLSPDKTKKWDARMQINLHRTSHFFILPRLVAKRLHHSAHACACRHSWCVFLNACNC